MVDGQWTAAPSVGKQLCPALRPPLRPPPCAPACPPVWAPVGGAGGRSTSGADALRR